MVVFDTSVLLLALDPSTKPPLDPATNAAVFRAGERIEHLIDTLSADKKTIIIPTPVWPSWPEAAYLGSSWNE